MADKNPMLVEQPFDWLERRHPAFDFDTVTTGYTTAISQRIATTADLC
jgi:hypothetical protein